MTVLHITAAIRALSIPRNRGHSSLPLHSVPRFSPENGFVVSANFAEPAEPQVHSEYQPIIARVLAILSRLIVRNVQFVLLVQSAVTLKLIMTIINGCLLIIYLTACILFKRSVIYLYFLSSYNYLNICYFASRRWIHLTAPLIISSDLDLLSTVMFNASNLLVLSQQIGTLPTQLWRVLQS